MEIDAWDAEMGVWPADIGNEMISSTGNIQFAVVNNFRNIFLCPLSSKYRELGESECQRNVKNCKKNTGGGFSDNVLRGVDPERESASKEKTVLELPRNLDAGI